MRKYAIFVHLPRACNSSREFPLRIYWMQQTWDCDQYTYTPPKKNPKQTQKQALIRYGQIVCFYSKHFFRQSRCSGRSLLGTLLLVLSRKQKEPFLHGLKSLCLCFSEFHVHRLRPNSLTVHLVQTLNCCAKETKMLFFHVVPVHICYPLAKEVAQIAWGSHRVHFPAAPAVRAVSCAEQWRGLSPPSLALQAQRAFVTLTFQLPSNSPCLCILVPTSPGIWLNNNGLIASEWKSVNYITRDQENSINLEKFYLWNTW